jgi:hypothetical protein
MSLFLLLTCGFVGGAATEPAAFNLEKRRADHWAWQPVKPQQPPAIKDAAWPRTPIDNFILARLESAKLAPAPTTDRRMLIRRLYAVILGLPPSPEEVDAFAADASDGAAEKLVDRLLQSPQFGERWARHWLDLVRFSETLGNEADAPIHNAWRYRDYIIRALNADLPYNQLVTEHIAGDLLPKPRVNPEDHLNESILGTGFFWFNEGKRSPVDIRAAEAECFDNKIDVMCKSFLGLTVACARCHDHKFDAISAADYYALYGYLKSSRYTQAELNRAALDEHAAKLAVIRLQIRDLGSAALAERAADLARCMIAASGGPADPKLDASRLERWAQALKQSGGESHPLYAWAKLSEVRGSGPATIAARWQEIAAQLAAIAPTGKPREGDIEIANFGPAGFRNWFPEDQAFGSAPSQPGDFLLGDSADHPVLTLFRDGTWAHDAVLSRKLQGTLRSPTFTIDRANLHVFAAGRGARINVNIEHFVLIQAPLYEGLRKIPASDGGQWQTFNVAMWKGRRAYIEFADTTTLDLHNQQQGDEGTKPDGYLAVNRVVLSDQGPPPSGPLAVGNMFGSAAVDSLDALAELYQKVTLDSLAALRGGTLAGSADAEPRAQWLSFLIERGLLDGGPADPPARARLTDLFNQYHALELQTPDPVRAPANIDGDAQDEYIFIRGNHKNAGPVSPRRMLAAIAGPNQPAPPTDRSGRLELAARFTDPANPLTARVMVNRIWHHVFGRGLVASVDNFGLLGDQPTHPELLDYLAGRFVANGWSIKKMIRLMVLSRTFAMSSGGDAHTEEIDPANNLWHRGNVRRLEAEAIRDQILAVSGRLNRAMYGPGVEVFVTPTMQTYLGSYGKPDVSGPLDGDGRRSIYIKLRRNFLTPLLVAFDYPPPLNTAGRRSVSNVPAQALIILNDPFVAQQADLWAKRVLAMPGLTTEQRITRMYAEAFARPPTDDEFRIAGAFMQNHGAQLGLAPENCDGDERVWVGFAHVLMNVKEFIFIN